MRRCLEFFYRRLEVEGLENIPPNKPIIYASNHTNALMDPLMISYFAPTQHYFMTRGDVFRFPVIGSLFRSWRMLPLFRMKDGIDTLSQNNEIMDFITNKLVEGHAMIIFPEGSHFWKRQVHPLRKGLVRMAYDVLERDPQTELVIIPVGFYYNDMVRVNQDAFVKFGKAIPLRDFPREENQAKTFNTFNKELREAMREQIIDISLEEDDYLEAEAWREQLAKRLRRLPVKTGFTHQKYFIRVISSPEFRSELKGESLSLDEVLNKEPLKDWWSEVEKTTQGPDFGNIVLKVLKYPFYLLAFLHYLPLFLISRSILSNIKDQTFHCSVKFGLGLIFQPVLSLLQAGILAWALGSWWWFGIYLVLMPVWSTLFSEWRGDVLKVTDPVPQG